MKKTNTKLRRISRSAATAALAGAMVFGLGAAYAPEAMAADTGTTSGGADTLMVRRGNTFYFNYALEGGDADFSITAGEPDDTVLTGDWDGDGVDTICLRRGNTCCFIDDITTMNVYLTVTYGRAGDEVLVGDWDGDGKDSLAVRRNGNIYYFCNDITDPDADTWSASYGRAADEVLAGDWENSGYDSLAARRDGNVYYFSLSSVTDPDGDVWKTTFGRAGDEVLAGDWDGNGTDTLAMRRDGNTYFISNSIASPDSGVDSFTYGRAADEVYAGTWTDGSGASGDQGQTGYVSVTLAVDETYGTGTISFTGQGSSVTTQEFAAGTTVYVTATPDEGYAVTTGLRYRYADGTPVDANDLNIDIVSFDDDTNEFVYSFVIPEGSGDLYVTAPFVTDPDLIEW